MRRLATICFPFLAAVFLAPLPASAVNVRSDFNGDGYSDLAVGVPGKGDGSSDAAGAVAVLYGSSSGLTAAGNQLFLPIDLRWTAQYHAVLGNALATGDFDGDGYADLAVTAPGRDVRMGGQTLVFAGEVYILYGSSTGLSTSRLQTWNGVTAGLPGGAKEYDYLGNALATGDFNDDDCDDLAVGISRRDIVGKIDAGAVMVLYGGPGTGLSGPVQLWHLGVDGMVGRPREMAGFGTTLAAGDFDGNGADDLAVGAPGENLREIYAAGAVYVVYGQPVDGLAAAGSQRWHQNKKGVPGEVAAGDHFGLGALAPGDFDNDGYVDLAIGTTPDKLRRVWYAGSVNVLYGATGGLQTARAALFHLNSPLGYDEYGYSLAAGDFDGTGYDDLAVGATGRKAARVDTAGVVQVLFGSGSGLDGSPLILSQASPGVDGEPGYNHLFGKALTALDFDGDGRPNLAVGVMLDDVGSVAAGTVTVFSGPFTTGTRWHQGVTGVLGAAKERDLFGFALGQ